MAILRSLKWLVLVLLISSLGVGTALGQKKKEENEFPNATRKDPKSQISERNAKKINAAYALLDEGEYEKAAAALEEIRANPKASKYEQALALTGLANIAWEEDDAAKAIELNQQAVALDALDNRSQFQTIFQIAQLGLMEERYDVALAAIDQWLTQTGSMKPESLALRGNALYRLERFPEAAEAMKQAIAASPEPSDTWYQILIASYYDAEQFSQAAEAAQQVLAREPDNKKVIQQLAAIYVDMEQEPKALETLKAAYDRGILNEEKDLRQLWQMYNYLEKPAEAAAVINDGLAKGVLTETFDVLKGLADAYVLSAQAAPDETAAQRELFAKAVDAYTRAAPKAEDGEIELQRGQLMIQELEKFAEGKAAILAALAKGKLKREGEAYILLGNAESELGNNQAAIAAYRKAAGFASTKQMAESWLKAMQGG
jgi:tetratricopeptide (TPR) repeat protein